jgi:transketolase
MVKLSLIPIYEFQRVRAAPIHKYRKLGLLADMCRANTLVSVKRAGSGHLGSSFSSLDIVTLLYYAEMNTAQLGIEQPDRDIYFSSKGHDVPGLYAVLFALGILPKDKFIKLRRRGGTFGHPDIRTPGIEANSGSLGMGISKAKGIAAAKALLGRGGRVFVMTGDGELQEGQIYEALQTAAHQEVNNLSVIVDHNKVQSDKPVAEITDLADLASKCRAFGWHVARCDGHDFRQLERVFAEFSEVADRPKMLIADTLKGRGVSFMEHPAALAACGGLYRWHAGAPDDQSFEAAFAEITERVNHGLVECRLAPLQVEELAPEPRPASGVAREFVADAFGQALVEAAAEREDIVVLDGDLASDCRIRAFELKYPQRFIENGIAEQDMVSMAGGLALQGLLPVVNTFASFLAAKSNEQIYNNACEQTKIIYVCHYAGLIPAGPGSSHQSIRDISLFGALPDCIMLQPCNVTETRMALRYCIDAPKGIYMLRLVIGPSPRIIALPSDYRLTPGRGAALTDGSDAALFAYGPVMLNEALLAAELLKAEGLGLRVVNMPWLNRFDPSWLGEVLGSCRRIYVVDDHSPVGALGDAMLNALVTCGLLSTRRFKKFGVEGYPACGTPQEALQYHGLDGASLAGTIRVDGESI